MNLSLLPALILFAFVTSITPGPNNLMLLASGVNFGFRRTIPHMLGIGIGFTVMVAAIGFGLAQIFIIWPLAYTVLKFSGALYMVWLAWKISQSGPVEGGKIVGRPMTFLQAAGFQWLNPKASHSGRCAQGAAVQLCDGAAAGAFALSVDTGAIKERGRDKFPQSLPQHALAPRAQPH